MPDIQALTDMILAKMRPNVEEVARQVVIAKERASGPITPDRLPPATQLPEITETVQDIVAGLLRAGSNINLVYADPENALTISSTGYTESVTVAGERVYAGGILVVMTEAT